MDGDPPNLFVSNFGSGRPMLCLHGVESHGLRFVALAARLPGMRVIAPDLPGHGRSSKVGPWTVERTIGELLPLLRDLEGTDSPLLLGHSYGGLLAWELARAATEVGVPIGALVLVDPAIAVDASLAEGSLSYEASSVGHRWPDEVAALTEMAAARPVSGRWSAALDVGVGMEADVDGALVPLVSGEAVAAAWAHMQRPLRVSPYAGPTLLIEAGREQGRFVSPAVVAQLRAALGARLAHVVLDTTHTIPSDYPELLATTVRKFLATL